MVYSEFVTAEGVLTPIGCYKFTVNHNFLGIIASFYNVLYIKALSKVLPVLF